MQETCNIEINSKKTFEHIASFLLQLFIYRSVIGKEVTLQKSTIKRKKRNCLILHIFNYKGLPN